MGNWIENLPDLTEWVGPEFLLVQEASVHISIDSAAAAPAQGGQGAQSKQTTAHSLRLGKQ